MRTTIKMVAKHANVSRGTVDRVLNKRGNVKPEVEQRVIKSLKVLNYQPNTAARALAFNKNIRKIGFLIPNKVGFFKEEVTRGIEKGKEESEYLGIKIIVAECDPSNPNEYIKAIDEMLENDVSGFAISAQSTTSLVEKINQLEEKGIPVITVNSDIANSKRRVFVGEDALKTGRIAGELVYKQLENEGRILIVAGIPEFEAHVSRIRGFQDFMREHGIKEDKYEVVYTYENYELTYSQVLEKISTNKELSSIYMATNSLVACTDAIARVADERDIFIVTHDTSPSTLELLKKGVVDFTIEQDMYRQGWKPIQLLRDYFLLDTPIENIRDNSIYHIISSECI